MTDSWKIINIMLQCTGHRKAGMLHEAGGPIMSSRYLERPYFSQDEQGFYKRGIFLRCSEQIVYQVLRDYPVNYYQFFCNDINMAYYQTFELRDIFVNDLFINERLVSYQSINLGDPQSTINHLLGKGEIVIFQTAINRLSMFKWYGKGDDYFETLKHKAMILAQDMDNYYILDSPYVRDSKGFNPFKENPEIGVVSKTEFLQSAEIRCELGYIAVDSSALAEVATVNRILEEIVKVYYLAERRQIGDTEIFFGRSALRHLIQAIENNQEIRNLYLLPYVSEVFITRLKILSICLKDYKYTTTILWQIEKIIDIWQTIKLATIKRSYRATDRIHTIILNQIRLLADQSDQLMETLVGYLKNIDI